jgi:type I restriction enzyme S subunit
MSSNRHLGDFFSNRQEPGRAGLPVMSVTMNDSLVNRDDLDLRVESTLRPDQHLLVKQGDIAYNMMRMWQGACGLATADGIVSPAYVVLAPKNGIDSRFAYHWFKSDRMIYLFWAYSHGLTEDRLRLYFDAFAEVPATPPPLQQQRRIAALLDAWDQAIDMTERLIAAKRRRYHALITRRLFGTHQPTGQEVSLTAKRVTGSNGWPLRFIGHFAFEVSRFNRAGVSLPVLSCTKRAGIVLSDEYFGGRRRVYSEDTSGYKIVERGHFAYATNHLEEGSIGLQNIVDSGLISPMYTVFETDNKLIDRRYLISVLKTETYRQVFEMNTSSSVERRGGLRWGDFAALPFALPPLEEQRRIASAIDALQADLEGIVSLLSSLRIQKCGLMQKMFSGEWQLNDRFDLPSFVPQLAPIGSPA